MVEWRDAMTQSKISCKPFAHFELKRVDEDSCENPIEPAYQRRDEGHKSTTTNPFSSKSKENHENKSNHLRNLDKNSSNRHVSSRHQNDQISLRTNHTNHRLKENERRSQVDVERSKRKRSPSESKEPKRARRSRSRSRDRSKRDRERNAYERGSPVKVSHSSVGILLHFCSDLNVVVEMCSIFSLI